MLDITLIRENPDIVRKTVADKQGDPKIVDTFLKLDQLWRTLTGEIDTLRAEQRQHEEKKDLDAARETKATLKEKEKGLTEIADERKKLLYAIPNIPSEDTPVGKDESENTVLRLVGKKPSFDFSPKEHWELGKELGIIEIEKAADVSGARFAYLKGDAVLIQFALIQHAMRVLTDRKILEKIIKKAGLDVPATPFIPVIPPVLIKPEVMERMARLEPRDDRYHTDLDDLYLVGSAEHTLGPLHMNETVPEENLPIRYAGYSTAFRREAGTYGKDTKGILRLHQFDKLEIESFTVPEKSLEEHEFFIAIQEYLMQSLEVPYQIVLKCTGDMGDPNARAVDIETWMPGQDKYRETHTADLMTDYQARRLKAKVKRKDGSTEILHMNDATGFAIGRTLIAIIENYQTKKGTVRIPKILQKYVGKKEISN